MNSENALTSDFWKGFIRAVEAEPVEASYIEGASGLRHEVAALGLDKSRRRLIVVACAKDAREAAFTQADLQSVFKAVQVIVARSSTEEVAANKSDVNAEDSPEDRRAGLCYLSIAGYASDEIELLSKGADIEAVRETFRRHNLLQYFFPAPDHLALGLVESGRVHLLHQLIDQLVRTPDAGHPFGPPELMKSFYSFTEMVKELQNLGLVTEDERDLKLTDKGSEARAAVRGWPREGLLYKILNRLEANLYLKSLLLPK
ncbi:MAG TPA: hypothetical protein VF791_17910 [Pyrinomonadaceae bacterium]